ncbi:N-6 DNA methylase [Arthrobacter rhizosphaerae]|uniref:N-6 DNA methylase n=1 Tax=Arthrobacter rhizosphaerae TaxID=2855490 RepID=UPI001FF47A96|nr:N-6 DNA methylase [Arthrobacter rhizosphaerae]
MARYHNIVKLLEANTGARRLANIFDDFVQMSALSFRNSVDPHDHAEREKQYLFTAGSYTPKQLERFTEALSLVVMAMEEEPGDVLGRLYMELDLGNERLGQFYTPYDVASLLAGMTVDTVSGQIAEQGFARVYEPTCGAGAFLVAITQAMRRAGLDYQRQLHVTAEDISAQAVHMAYIHLTLLHVPAIVYRRNTLTQETFDAWPTPAHVLGCWDSKLLQTATTTEGS